MSSGPLVPLLLLAVVANTAAAALSAGEAAAGRISRVSVTDTTVRASAHARLQTIIERRHRVLASAVFVRLLAEMTGTVAITMAMTSVISVWQLAAVAAIATCALVAFLLVRTSPRSLGRRYPAKVLVVMAPVLLAVERVLGGLARAATVEPDHDEDLRDIVDMAAEEESIAEEDRELVRSVLSLGGTMTREVMVPRTDMVTTDDDVALGKVLTLLLRSGFSRVPVVGESVDDVRGVVYLKDIVRRLNDDPEAAELPASAIARPAVVIPEFKPVDDLLRELQAGSSHLALVVDEYGGIAGLVTVEDALEEIVGELVDEHDHSAPSVEDLGDGTFRVPARLSKDDLGDLFGLDVEDDDVDTAAGLLAKAIGKVPISGATGEIHGLHLTAEQSAGRRKQIATLLVRRAEPADDDEAHQRQRTTTPKDSTR